MRGALLAGLTGFWLVAAAQSSGRADIYPSHPITLMVPFAVGGPSDAMARIPAERMAVKFGQNILIENVTGAAGSIAVIKAANVKVE